MRFNPVLAANVGITIAILIGAYLIYEKVFGSGKSSVSTELDTLAFDHGYNNAVNAAQPNQTYITARSAWFKENNLSGSAALQRASQQDFPTEQQWVDGTPFPAF